MLRRGQGDSARRDAVVASRRRCILALAASAAWNEARSGSQGECSEDSSRDLDSTLRSVGSGTVSCSHCWHQGPVLLYEHLPRRPGSEICCHCGMTRDKDSHGPFLPGGHDAPRVEEIDESGGTA